MGGILSAAGVPGFLGNLEGLYAETEDETAPWQALVTAWWSGYKGRSLGVEDLFELVEREELLLDVLGEGNDRSRRTRLGRALGTIRDRVIGGFRITSVGPDNRGRQQYRLEPVHEPTSAEMASTSPVNVGGDNRSTNADFGGNADLCRHPEQSSCSAAPERNGDSSNGDSSKVGETSAHVGNVSQDTAKQRNSDTDVSADLRPTSPTSRLPRPYPYPKPAVVISSWDC
jgi:hypothetical protein